MSALANTQPLATSSKRLITSMIAVLGLLVAAAVVVLALALPGTSRPTVAVHHGAAVYEPLIQFRGTGAPPRISPIQATATSGQATATDLSAADDSSPAFSRAVRFIRLGR